MIWDTHAHLDDKQFHQDLEETLARARAAGVTRILNIGHSEQSSRCSVDLAGRYDWLYATIGVHPHDARTCTLETWDRLRRLAQNPKVLAWGEIGLDYYRDLSPRDVQRAVFIQQIELANEMGLPIVIHDRDAHADIVKIIKEHPPERGGVFHSYSGSWEMAKDLLKRGFYLSFSGPLTYRNARQPVEVATQVPLDRFVVETDCPYLPPVPYRGQRNEPAYVQKVAAKIAELRALPMEAVARLSTENARVLFGLKKGE